MVGSAVSRHLRSSVPATFVGAPQHCCSLKDSQLEAKNFNENFAKKLLKKHYNCNYMMLTCELQLNFQIIFGEACPRSPLDSSLIFILLQICSDFATRNSSSSFCISEARASWKTTLLSIKPAKLVSQLNAPITRPTSHIEKNCVFKSLGRPPEEISRYVPSNNAANKES